jgi:hypothetical protein
MIVKEFRRRIAEAELEYVGGYVSAEAFAERVIGIYFLAYPDGRDSVGYPGGVGVESVGGSDGCAEGTK